MKEQQTFEQLVTELETIVDDLDSSLGLEESLKKFERGMELAKQAEARLKTIENEFTKIQAKFKSVEVVEVVEETLVETAPAPKKGDDIDLSELPF
jgi:exodeoxyribonuclease VII small subunit